ncbi:MAG: acetyl-CoA carboxylase biotin carboxyl carrier protein [Candidatus Sumerlaeia bacterium]
MNLDEIKELISVMRKNKIREIDLEQKGTKVKIVASGPEKSKKPAEAMSYPQVPPPQYIVQAPQAQEATVPQPASLPGPAAPKQEAPKAAQEEKQEKPAPEEIEGVEVKSPMVGTFYRAPAPDAPNYVDEGSVINNDTVLCIVEAMKLMNEIKAEMRGKILRVLVENGQPVEYNQPLFLVEPF